MKELSYLDNNGHEVLEPGRFQVWVGGDSDTDLGGLRDYPGRQVAVIDQGE